MASLSSFSEKAPKRLCPLSSRTLNPRSNVVYKSRESNMNIADNQAASAGSKSCLSLVTLTVISDPASKQTASLGAQDGKRTYLHQSTHPLCQA